MSRIGGFSRSSSDFDLVDCPRMNEVTSQGVVTLPIWWRRIGGQEARVERGGSGYVVERFE